MNIKGFHPIDRMKNAAISTKQAIGSRFESLWSGIKVSLNISGLKPNAGKVTQTTATKFYEGVQESSSSTLSLDEVASPQKSKPSTSFKDLAKEIKESKGSPRVTSQQMELAVKYLDEHEQEIEELLQRAKDDSNAEYIVLKKENTGLSYNIEYHGKGEDGKKLAFLRYHKDFAKGSFKMASRMVDLYGGQLIVKTKMIIKQPNQTKDEALSEANRYKKIQQPLLEKGYVTKPVSLEEAVSEAQKGKDVKGVLQNIKFVQYDKQAQAQDKVAPAQVTKAAFYSVAQKGEIEPNSFKNKSEKKQAARGMIKRVAEFHKQGKCHNDIKGANFLWNRNKKREIEVNIIDVAMANGLNEANYYMGSGTPKFMPPEILLRYIVKEKADEKPSLDQHKLNTAKDAFALGMALAMDVYALATDAEVLRIDPYTLYQNDPVAFEELAAKYGIDAKQLQAYFKNPSSLDKQTLSLLDSVLNYIVIYHYLDDLSEFAGIDSSMKNVIRQLLDPDPKKRMTPERAAKELGITLD